MTFNQVWDLIRFTVLKDYSVAKSGDSGVAGRS